MTREVTEPNQRYRHNKAELTLSVRLKREDYDLISAAAETCEISRAEFMRRTLLRVARDHVLPDEKTAFTISEDEGY